MDPLQIAEPSPPPSPERPPVFPERPARCPAPQGALETPHRYTNYASYSSSFLLPENPFLNAFAFERFARVQITLRVDGEAADADELSGKASTGSKGRHELKALAQENVNFLVVAVCDVHVSLLWILGKRDVPD